jgi:hypothetical protein
MRRPLPERGRGGPARALVGVAVSESPRYGGRAVEAPASDPERFRRNEQSVSSRQLVRVYGFTDVNGRRPDGRRYMEDVEAPGISRTTGGATTDGSLRRVAHRLLALTLARAAC